MNWFALVKHGNGSAREHSHFELAQLPVLVVV